MLTEDFSSQSWSPGVSSSLFLKGSGVGRLAIWCGSEACFEYDQRALLWLLSLRSLIQDVSHVVPLCAFLVAVWTFNFVLALLKPPFDNIQDIPMLTLLQKVAFLAVISSGLRVAALSCMPPYLVLHRDKAGVRPSLFFFFPKVVSDFNLNEDTILSSLCPWPSHVRRWPCTPWTGFE